MNRKAHSLIFVSLITIITFQSTQCLLAGEIHDAAYSGDLDTVIEFVEGNKATINELDSSGHTPLIRACKGNHPEIVRFLIKSGADGSIAQSEGDKITALHLAARIQSDNPTIAKLLLEANAHVNATDAYGQTPLHVACHWGNVTIAQLLIEAKADVHLVDEHGATPLHAASTAIRMEGKWPGGAAVTELLLEHGARTDVKNTAGKTPLQLVSAMPGDNRDVTTVLRDHIFAEEDATRFTSKQNEPTKRDEPSELGPSSKSSEQSLPSSAGPSSPKPPQEGFSVEAQLGLAALVACAGTLTYYLLKRMRKTSKPKQNSTPVPEDMWGVPIVVALPEAPQDGELVVPSA